MSEGWGGPAVRGSGGGLNRELCRTFGHYNRHLARLQHNLRETKKFFRDIKYSQGPPVFPVANAGPVGEEPPEQHPAPSAVDSAPAGGGASLQTGKCEGRNRDDGVGERPAFRLLGRGGAVPGTPSNGTSRKKQIGTAVVLSVSITEAGKARALQKSCGQSEGVGSTGERKPQI